MTKQKQDPNEGFDTSNTQLYAETKLPNHDSPYDSANLVLWAERLAPQAQAAFDWETD